MDIRYYIGIDIAKSTLDWAVYTLSGIQLRTQTSNTVDGVKIALQHLEKLPHWHPKNTVFCMEHTHRLHCAIRLKPDRMGIPRIGCHMNITSRDGHHIAPTANIGHSYYRPPLPSFRHI